MSADGFLKMQFSTFIWKTRRSNKDNYSTTVNLIKFDFNIFTEHKSR